jgi:hypothetical protein
MWPVVAIIGGFWLLDEYLTKREAEKINGKRLFISHSWKKSSCEYKKFVNKLHMEEVDFFDHSIPEEKAVDAESRAELRKVFRNKMRNCDVVFVLATSGTKESSFVGLELEIAEELQKEIIAITPHGQSSVPPFIKRKASKIISNNKTSILNSLKQ